MAMTQSVPFKSWVAVTPNDSTNLPAGVRAIYIGGAGNVALRGRDGISVTFTAVPVGTLLHVSPVRVNSTNTTATLILALY